MGYVTHVKMPCIETSGCVEVPCRATAITTPHSKCVLNCLENFGIISEGLQRHYSLLGQECMESHHSLCRILEFVNATVGKNENEVLL